MAPAHYVKSVRLIAVQNVSPPNTYSSAYTFEKCEFWNQIYDAF